MEPTEFLLKMSEVLERLKVNYLTVGSMASIAYGEPRLTNDIDMVVDLPLEQVDPLCASFPAPDYYCFRESVLQAIRERFQFNIIHLESGLKIDVFIPDGSEFSRSQLSRAVRARMGAESDVMFASPEDVILKKLEYYKEGGSEKHIRDIAGILKVQGERIDRPYIDEWAARLNLSETWRDVLALVEKH